MAVFSLREKPGTRIKTQKDVNGRNEPTETFQSVKEGNLFKFSGGPTKNVCYLGVNGKNFWEAYICLPVCIYFLTACSVAIQLFIRTGVNTSLITSHWEGGSVQP
jgi:hypothetical protein